MAAEDGGSLPGSRTSLRHYADPAGHGFSLVAVPEGPVPAGSVG
ncbi:hypothetical protein ACLF6K_38290 (plasmid) [Streptomyces xanthophaeus]